MKKPLLYFVLLALFFASCEDDPATKKDDPLTLLTSKAWKPAVQDKNSSTSPAGNNSYHATLNCELDDTYQFTSSNKLTINRGQAQCSANEANSEQTDYSVDFNAKTITVKGMVYTLAEVSATQLKFYIPTPAPSGYVNVVFLFEH